MTALQRAISTGVVISLHAVPPGKSGASEVARSKPIAAATFSELNDVTSNGLPVVCDGTATQRASYGALWIDNRIEATWRLVTPVNVTRGSPVTFPRGSLKIGWQRGS